MRRPTVLAFAAFACAAAAIAQGPIVNTVLNHGSTATHYDMVILGDGYQVQEQTRFNQDVTAFLTGLFNKAPYSMLSVYFNVHTVFRASQDSGASHPDVTPPIVRNTAYGASYNTGGTARCLYIQNTSLALADAALAPANETRVLVMVNDSRYGGCAGQFAVSYNGASMIEVQSHELGHAAAQLADEYDYPNGNYTGQEPSNVNITRSNVGQKWSHWWGVENVGAFQGAGYYLTGLYRPRSDCLMRSLGITLCPVCREQITRAINNVVDAIDSPQPAVSSVPLLRPNTQTFSFTNLVPPTNNPTTSWLLDNATMAGQTGTSVVLDSNLLTIGTHTLAVRVQDNTPVVRLDPGQAMVHTHAWSVVVTDPTACNLHITSHVVAPQLAPVGSEVTLTFTVTNDGPAAAGAFTIEHFLSTNGTVETTDLYLGGVTVAGLGVGQQQQIVRAVRVPNYASVSPYVVIASIDRQNALVESNENDNLSATVLLAQAGDCTPTLEYRDDLLYPRDGGAIAVTGGTLRPTVTARCNPGEFYLIAWGCSGTVPGTQLAPGVTVPLNVDVCTQTLLDNLNGSVFQAFLGPLDAQGHGFATLTVPTGLQLSALPGHLAAVIFDANVNFTAATNAVVFDLQ